jgi:hypothetical protein
MWIEIFVSVIALLIVAFVWRFVSRVWTSHEPIEPAGNADILAGLHPRPTLNSGAVALDEPDDESERPWRIAFSLRLQRPAEPS